MCRDLLLIYWGLITKNIQWYNFSHFVPLFSKVEAVVLDSRTRNRNHGKLFSNVSYAAETLLISGSWNNLVTWGSFHKGRHDWKCINFVLEPVKFVSIEMRDAKDDKGPDIGCKHKFYNKTFCKLTPTQ